MRFFKVRLNPSASLFLFVSAALMAQETTHPAAGAGAAGLASAASVASVASPVAAGPAAAEDAYAGEPLVIEQADWVYAMKADGTGYRVRRGVIKIQSEASLKEFSVIRVQFASASEHVEFRYARVRHKDGSLTETAASEAIEQPERVTREAPFYSDLKQEQLPIKNLKVGDTLEWEARIVRTKAEAPGEFWDYQSFVTSDTVVLKESIELRVPVGKPVTVWTNPAKTLKAVETTEGDERVYRWTSSQLTPTVGAAAEAEKKAKKTRVLTTAEYEDYRFGKFPDVVWTTFKNWEAVGAWYRGLEGDRAVPDDEIKAKVAELTAGKTTEEEKVRAVYAYASAQIRYIGVAFGIGRYQPHTAVDVLHNQYGDCKDKEMLLASMLEALGVQNDAVLIGPDLRFNKDVPSPGSFNHLITRAKVDGQEVWMDPTAEIAPYKMMYSSERDKEALVIPAKGAAMIERTPEQPPFMSEDVWVAKGTLDKDGISESHITLTMRGDDELSFRSTARSVTAGEYDETGEKIAKNLGYAGTLTHVSFGKPDATEKPYVFEFDYHREKAGDWDNLKTVPQLEPVELPRFDEKNPPIRPIYLGTPRTETSTAEMKIPEGWSVRLPEAVHERTSFASYDLTYKFENGTIHTERKVVVLQTRLPEKDWKAYQKWADKVDIGSDPYIQLIRGGGGVHTTGKNDKSAGDHVSSDDAEALIHQSFASSEKSDFKTSETLLKRAKSLDPQARRLWAAYGVMALDKHKYGDAIDDFHKELELYPDAYEEYEVIIDTQRLKGDTPGMQETAQAWVKVDPKNAKAEKMLADVLLEAGDGVGAVAAANASLALLPEAERSNDEDLQATLGRAQLKAGQTEKGTATLVALLKSTDSPAMMNNLAYELADAKRELPLDEERQRVALEKMAAESQAWTLDETVGTLVQKTDLLVAAWDTMGWILFREGKTAEALNYLEAAWHDTGKKSGKEHVEQARAALPDSNREREPDPGSEKARTVQLGKATGKKGFAEYKLLISNNKVDRALPVKDDKTLDGAEEMIKAAVLPKMFPTGSTAKMVRGAIVSCLSKCEMVLETVN